MRGIVIHGTDLFQDYSWDNRFFTSILQRCQERGIEEFKSKSPSTYVIPSSQFTAYNKYQFNSNTNSSSSSNSQRTTHSPLLPIQMEFLLYRTTSSSIDPSFTRSPIDADNTLLDPQLLTLQPSPQHMLPTPFTTADHNQLPTAMDQSPESLNPRHHHLHTERFHFL